MGSKGKGRACPAGPPPPHPAGAQVQGWEGVGGTQPLKFVRSREAHRSGKETGPRMSSWDSVGLGALRQVMLGPSKWSGQRRGE